MATSHVRASFEVHASNSQDLQIDVEGLTPAQIVERIYSDSDGISICHQCSDDVDDPQLGDLVGFTVDGKDYTYADGEWVEYHYGSPS